MGKDSKSSGETLSRDELRGDHLRLVEEERRLNSKYEEVKALFRTLEGAYEASKESFTLSRYGQLKEMIKTTSNEMVVEAIRQSVQQPNSKQGMSGLLQRAQEFSGESTQAGQAQSSAKASGKGSKFTGFMKKLKNATGFSDDPIADEDVMSNSDLQRDNARKMRAISRYKTQLGKAVTKLEKLQHSYQASKSHAPPKRYQELKDMIKETVAEKLV